MSCPYFRESYFAICVANDAIHVPSIDEMERFCFRSWYMTCPSLSLMKGPERGRKTLLSRDIRTSNFERISGAPLGERDRDNG